MFRQNAPKVSQEYNAPKVSKEYAHMEKTLKDLTPGMKAFAEESIYPAGEVESDIELLKDFKQSKEYKEHPEHSKDKLLEATFASGVELGDWFGESKSYEDDPDFQSMVTTPTSEIDDKFNHIDVIGMIRNRDTNHETTPLAFDLTYNSDRDSMRGKIRWVHVYGKKDTLPEGASEFGRLVAGDKKDEIKTKSWSTDDRYGLKIPGFVSAKYYRDMNGLDTPVREAGRIKVMPRFVVGFSPDIAKVLAEKKPSSDEYKNAERCAKWCTLYECSAQASDIHDMLERLDEEEIKLMIPEELEEAKKQSIAMKVYFERAFEVAQRKAEANPDMKIRGAEMAAKDYALNKDEVCMAIRKCSRDIIKYHSRNRQK